MIFCYYWTNERERGSSSFRSIVLISLILFTWFLSIIGFLVVLFNYFFFIFFFVSIPADSNRVPYDLPEAESEPVAGFITEYSTIYFSIILLTEYANIIALTYLIILVFSIYPLPLVFILYFICLIRSTLNRLKFDELMISARLVILPIIFSFLLLSLFWLLRMECNGTKWSEHGIKWDEYRTEWNILGFIGLNF